MTKHKTEKETRSLCRGRYRGSSRCKCRGVNGGRELEVRVTLGLEFAFQCD